MAIYVNGFVKKSEAIKGEVKTTGFFDVDYEKISSQRLFDKDISFPGGDLYLITELNSIKYLSDYQIYIEDYLWYYFAPNYISGKGIIDIDNSEIITMFEPKIMKRFVDLIIENGDDIKSNMDEFVQEEIEKFGEFEFLKSFRELLNLAQEKNALISFRIC